MERHDYELTKFICNTADEMPKVEVELHRIEGSYRRTDETLDSLNRAILSQTKNKVPSKAQQAFLDAKDLQVKNIKILKQATKDEANLEKARAILQVDTSKFDLLNQNDGGAASTNKVRNDARKVVVKFSSDNKGKYPMKNTAFASKVRDDAVALYLSGYTVDIAFQTAYDAAFISKLNS